MADLIQEIKDKLSIDQVVSDYIPIKKTGRSYKANCPFHKEKTPSFIITPEKGLAYCFGCHSGGDMFEFIEKIENVDFPESVRILAKKAGLENKLSSFTNEKHSKLTPLFEYNRELANAYYKHLFTPDAEKAMKYLEDRGVTLETIKKFGIGYAPDKWEFAKDIAIKKALSQHDMILSGALIRSPENKIYDRFRNRIIFPICNAQGTVLAYSGRTLDKQEPAKYVNSSDSPIFSKRSALFGIHLAKQSIKEMGYVIVVEGQFDVVLCHQVGIKNVVATSGTAFTKEHLKILSRFTENIAFAFDADTAGIEAAKKAIELSLLEDFSVKVIVLPKGQDPADIVKNGGKDTLVEVLKNAKSSVEFYFDVIAQSVDLSTSLGKKKLIANIYGLYNAMNSSVEKTEMIKFLSLKAHIREEDLREELDKKKTSSSVKEKEEDKHYDFKPGVIEYLFAFMIRYPLCFQNDASLLTLLDLLPEPWKLLYNELKDKYNQSVVSENTKDLLNINSIKNTNILKLSVFLEEEYPFDFSEQEIQKEFNILIHRLKESYKKKRRKEITIDMKIAEANNEREYILKLEEEQIKLLTL